MKIPTRARYRKRVGAFRSIDSKHDGSVIDFNVSPLCYNYDFTSGALKVGYGVSAHAAVPADISRYWIYRYYSSEAGKYVDQYVIQYPNGRIRYYDSYKDKLRFISTFAYAPMTAINYRLNSKDVLLMSCEGRKLFTWDGSAFTEHSNTPTISSMALHYERLFVTSKEEPTKVFFSDDLDPTNWSTGADAGGFIELLDERGDLNKVVSFGSYLYIFRDHGISRVTAYADQSEFSVVNLFVSAGRIFPSSIAKCGACIMFLASDGLYMFDGYECARVLGNLDGLIEASDSCACAFFNGKYYLSCKMNFPDGKAVGCEAEEHTANALLVFDTSTREYSIARGLDIRFMNACTYLGEDMLVACESSSCGVVTKCGKRFDAVLPKHWQSPVTDLSLPDKRKALREIHLRSGTDVALSVTTEKKTKTYAVKAGDRRVRVNAQCKKFSLAVDSEEEASDVKPPTLIYSVF